MRTHDLGRTIRMALAGAAVALVQTAVVAHPLPDVGGDFLVAGETQAGLGAAVETLVTLIAAGLVFGVAADDRARHQGRFQRLRPGRARATEQTEEEQSSKRGQPRHERSP